MPSIASATDPPLTQQIEDLWGEIAAVTGHKQLAGARRPHIVLHVAARYDAAVHDVLANIAASTTPFDAPLGRIGVFRARTTAVIAIEVPRSPQLDALHETLWRDLAPIATAPKDVYRPDTWAPHITVATGALDDAQLALTRDLLARAALPAHAPITNLCLIPHDRAVEWRRFNFPVDRADSAGARRQPSRDPGDVS